MYLRLMPNLLHFLPDLRCAPSFYEMHPKIAIQSMLSDHFVAFDPRASSIDIFILMLHHYSAHLSGSTLCKVCFTIHPICYETFFCGAHWFFIHAIPNIGNLLYYLMDMDYQIRPGKNDNLSNTVHQKIACLS
jgi:hypothetical protein